MQTTNDNVVPFVSEEGLKMTYFALGSPELRLIAHIRRESERVMLDGGRVSCADERAPWWLEDEVMTWFPGAVEATMSAAHRRVLVCVLLLEMRHAQVAELLGFSEVRVRQMLEEVFDLASRLFGKRILERERLDGRAPEALREAA